jgi:ABC-type Zn uptake system ZnuABC Zn-binding protein ZnuA
MNRYTEKLSEKIAEWQAMMEPIKLEKLIFYHNSWPYFQHRFGLVAANFIEPKPGIPPSPSHTASLIKQVKDQAIKVIAMEPFFDDRVPKMIARQTTAKVIVLPPSVGGVKDITDYIQLFDYNVKTIVEAVGK